LLQEGFAYDRCQVGVVTNLDPNETYSDCFVSGAEQLFEAVRSQVDVVLPSGAAVLNADDPAVADMARLCDGEVIFFSRDPLSALIQAHLEAGGRAVLIEGHFIRFQKGTGDLSTLAGLTIDHTDNLLDPAKAADYAAALGAAWALEVPLQLICVAIEGLVGEAFPHLVS
jgi:cyanophycin synthetase